ncbi:MAG: hypothetical protein JRH19_23095, partial [Deltaproteobacteria bacterium]|nr:hypothetical protein [Deltaproteobacteria bacterium]
MQSALPRSGRARIARTAWLRALVLGMTTLAGSASVAGAGSRMTMPYPTFFGTIPAATYDVHGNRLGDAFLAIDLRDDGSVEMDVVSGIDGGAKNVVHAELEPVRVGEETRLRIVRQRSQSFEPSGEPMVMLEVDHEKGVARCTPPGKDPESVPVVKLPKEDRVANVPLNLLFQPLARGERKRLKFQVFLCLGGPRLVNFIAKAAGEGKGKKSQVREIRYGPDFGKMFSWVVDTVTPELYFWFDAGGEGQYIGHRMPLYSKGPEVLIVRDGFPP